MKAVSRTSKTRRRRRLSAATITLIAAVFAVGWAEREGADARVVEAAHMQALLATPAVRIATPLALASSAEATQLQRDLASVIRVPGWSNDAWGVLVVSLDHGDTLFSHRPDELLAPASNLKLYTSASALYYLGPQYRYGTYLVTTAPVVNGVLEGDVYLYGTGDPTLSDRIGEGGMEVWRAFADTLAMLGVREVRGGVVGDGSFFEGSGTGGGWQESYINAWYAAPAGALSFNENVTTLRVTPGDEVGWRPEVLTVPGGAGVAVVNLATTVAGGGSRIEVTRAAYDGPIVVRGEIGSGSGAHWAGVPVPDPARFSAAAFREVLEDAGIRVTGDVRAVHDPAQSVFGRRKVFAHGFDDGQSPRVVAMHHSPPLFEILSVVNKRSHNMYAEQVLRTVGRAVVGSGSVEGGERAVSLMMERELGAAPTALAMKDGSGLSVLDQVSPRNVIDLLSVMSESPMFETYLATLPEAGERGLRRMGGTAALGNLRAKTGTINNVSALSGYVTAANGERLAFSIISNGVPSTWRAKRVEDAIGARLASFTRPRPATAPAPRTDSAAIRPDSQRVAPPAAQQQPQQQPPAVEERAMPQPPAEPPAPRTHVIRSGDTLDGIAREYNTTVAALRQANPGLNPRRLIPGREVRLP